MGKVVPVAGEEAGVARRVRQGVGMGSPESRGWRRGVGLGGLLGLCLRDVKGDGVPRQRGGLLGFSRWLGYVLLPVLTVCLIILVIIVR